MLGQGSSRGRLQGWGEGMCKGPVARRLECMNSRLGGWCGTEEQYPAWEGWAVTCCRWWEVVFPLCVHTPAHNQAPILDNPEPGVDPGWGL